MWYSRLAKSDKFKEVFTASTTSGCVLRSWVLLLFAADTCPIFLGSPLEEMTYNYLTSYSMCPTIFPNGNEETNNF
jgi:hypothetical protein